MTISREIKFSIRAENALHKIMFYLKEEYSDRLQYDFLDKMNFALKAIQLNPEGFPKSEINNNQHKCVVTKQTTIYYRFNRNEIRILALFDTRMNPEKIKKIK